MAAAPSTTMQMGPSPTVTTTLAMTSIFTQPSDCATSWTYEPFKYNNWYPGILMQNCAAVVSSCFPSGFANSGRLSASVIYSPGYCPAGYTTADEAVNGEITTVTCCYSNFAYTTSAQINSHSATASFAGCKSSLPSSSSTEVPAVTIGGTRSQELTQLTGELLMWAQPITVLHQASDTSLLLSGRPKPTSSSSTMTSQTTSSSPSVSPSKTETSGPLSDTKNQPKMIPVAAIAGIGIGAGLSTFLIVAMLFWWFWRRRRSKGDKPGIMQPSSTNVIFGSLQTSVEKPPQELHSESRYMGPWELDSNATSAGKHPAEMPG